MEPILSKDDVAIYAGWALLGMAVLQAINIYASRETESPWRNLRSAVFFLGVGLALVFGLTISGWVGLVFGIAGLGEAWRLSGARSVRPELFGALGWFALGTAALLHDVIAPVVFWSVVSVALLSASASLFEAWRRYRHQRLTTSRVDDHAVV